VGVSIETVAIRHTFGLFYKDGTHQVRRSLGDLLQKKDIKKRLLMLVKR